MNVAEQIVESLLEGEMPDWLKKKISGKSEEDGDGDGDDKDSEGGKEKSDKPAKSKSSSSAVAGVCGPAPGKVKNSI